MMDPGGASGGHARGRVVVETTAAWQEWGQGRRRPKLLSEHGAREEAQRAAREAWSEAEALRPGGSAACWMES